jgi:hypothetical protein
MCKSHARDMRIRSHIHLRMHSLISIRYTASRTSLLATLPLTQMLNT